MRKFEVFSPGDTTSEWAQYVQRYANWDWRAPIFRDMIARDLPAMRSATSPVVLDIGCGRGFDDDAPLQHSIAGLAARYIGVEPDPDIQLADVFHESHRSILEAAPIVPASVDLAFSVMVLEHLEHPQAFWDKLHLVLRDGGVFWGFSVDARHWFAPVSRAARRLQLSSRYLDMLHGKGGEERYENYPAFYRSNTPRALRRLAENFSECQVISFSRIGQVNFYLPRILHLPSKALDHVARAFNLPGTVIAVRAVK